MTIESHHAVLPEALPLRAAIEIAVRERGGQVRAACLIAAASLVAPLVLAVASALADLHVLLAYSATIGYLGLGVSAGMQYLAAVRIVGGVDVHDWSVFMFAALFPLWGPVVFVISLLVGGPLVCSGIWAAMITPRIAGRRWRASRLGMISGGASLGVWIAAVVVSLFYNAPELIAGLMAGGAPLVWHVVMAVGLVLAGCRGYCERRAGAAECLGCGYDLLGLPERTACCPECGFAIAAPEPRPPHNAPS